MNVTVPIYIEELRPEGSPLAVYKIRPLFFLEPEERDENLNRAVNKLAKSLKREFDSLGAKDSHQELAAYTFCPDVEDRLLKLDIDLGKRRVASRLLLVVLEGLGRKLAFTPTVPDLWFEIARGEKLQERALEVLTRHCRDQEKKLGRELTADEVSVRGKAWVTTLELDMHPPLAVKKRVDSRFAMIGGAATLDGAAELRAVGRCLDWQYPDDLDRVVCRDRELAEFTRIANSEDRRPVLLIGPRMVGKTALIHEYVYQRVAKRRSQFSEKKNVWLLSPQRLISGMIYVGQWENRLLAILDRAHERDHTLYFDDVLGLFHAGISRDSSLSVADVIKPYVEKREFRMLAEMTPEAFNIFQERDRAFADMFQVVRLSEPNEDDTLRILMSVNRELERSHRCQFDFDVLATVSDIHRRYVRDAAFPGKAALFLRQLALKYRGGKVTRDNVLGDFHAKSGLSATFLDDRARLERREVIEALGKEVIGQPASLNAAADVVCVAKSRLNDTSRPLGSFLFLGPTGVGKTQCAKSLAAYLFGDADRILRFDMNEYLSPSSAARLAGTFQNPEGLLTSAVRRQPFSVVLLDEIEKADHDVFNLLLQVMGEGRLTDALGRTADFTNAILIMTSNLGVREAGTNLGFRDGRSREGSAYIRAAEKFFKPEFFNRLDRVIPFEQLSREDIRVIARDLIQGVFAREGLLRRRVVLHVDDRAMEAIVDQGYHPTLGARALKRAIERHLTQPVAARLASMKAEVPTIISLRANAESDGGIDVRVESLTGAERQEKLSGLLERSQPKAIVASVEAAALRIEESAGHLRPEGAIAPEEIQPGHQRYFAIREQARLVKIVSESLTERLARPKGRSPSRGRGRHLPAGRISLRQVDPADLWGELMAAGNTHGYLRDLAAKTAPYGERVEDHLGDLLREVSLLDLLAKDDETASNAKALICVRSLGRSRQTQREILIELYTHVFSGEFGLRVTRLEQSSEPGMRDADFIVVSGPHALTLAKTEEGRHLFCPAHAGLAPIKVCVRAFTGEWDPSSSPSREELNVEETALSDVTIRVYEENGVALDLRSGLMTMRMPTPRELRALMLSMLPLPEHLQER